MSVLTTIQSHPFFQPYLSNKKWTISDKDKRPVNLHQLAHGNNYGANCNNPLSMCTLEEIEHFLQGSTPSNLAYYVTNSDGFCILDIEPKCPQPIKEKLMGLPCYYIETSLSGNGIHMVMPIDTTKEYPSVLKEKHGWYEILINHWATFTGSTLAHTPIYTVNEWNTLFTYCLEQTPMPTKTHIDTSDIIDIDDLENGQQVFSFILNNYEYRKTPSDFHDDISRYEYGTIAFYKYALRQTLRISPFDKLDYSLHQKRSLLYHIAQAIIPYREKHDTTRNNVPWLFYMICKLTNEGEME